jgi:hypothetical protein
MDVAYGSTMAALAGSMNGPWNEADQPDAHSVVTHYRVCVQDHADDHRHLLLAESLSARTA